MKEARRRGQRKGQPLREEINVVGYDESRRIVTHWNFLILTLFSWQDFQRTELFFPFVPGGVSKHSGPVHK